MMKKTPNATLKYSPVHGAGGSPVLAGGNLVFNIDGTDKQMVVALDRKSGARFLKLPSEFDYARQAILYLPRRMPDPRSAVESALRQAVANMRTDGLGHVERFAESYNRWPEQFGDRLGAALDALRIFTVKAGTGGAMIAPKVWIRQSVCAPTLRYSAPHALTLPRS